MRKDNKRNPAEPEKKKRGVLGQFGHEMFRLRKLFLSVPVIAAAAALAVRNLRYLPEQVGISFTESGEYALIVSRNAAVFVPCAVTAGCLLLMCLSRKVLYPWIISVLTLILPLLIWLTNAFI